VTVSHRATVLRVRLGVLESSRSIGTGSRLTRSATGTGTGSLSGQETAAAGLTASVTVTSASASAVNLNFKLNFKLNDHNLNSGCHWHATV